LSALREVGSLDGPSRGQRRHGENTVKSRDTKRESKKKPTKTLLEKRAAKAAKEAAKKFQA